MLVAPTLTLSAYLLTGDGDPLEAVFAHQILEGQLQFDLAFGRAAGIGGAIGYRDLLQSRTERARVIICFFPPAGIIIIIIIIF